MALPKKNDKEKFLKNNRLKELFSKAERIDNNLWQVLQEIGNSYNELSKNYDAIAQRLLMDILHDKKIKDKIHSDRKSVV